MLLSGEKCKAQTIRFWKIVPVSDKHWFSSFISFSIIFLFHIFSPGRGVACQKFGTLRIPKMLVKFPSAPTCPETHDPTSLQSFPMMFTKFSKSPKISDNTVGWTGPSPNLFFPPLFFFNLYIFWSVTVTAAFYFPKLNPPTVPLALLFPTFCQSPLSSDIPMMHQLVPKWKPKGAIALC